MIKVYTLPELPELDDDLNLGPLPQGSRCSNLNQGLRQNLAEHQQFKKKIFFKWENYI